MVKRRDEDVSEEVTWDFIEGLRAAIRHSCSCCRIQVTSFDTGFIRLGLCGTCRGLAENSLGTSGADMLDRVHLARRCPVNVRAREAKR